MSSVAPINQAPSQTTFAKPSHKFIRRPYSGWRLSVSRLRTSFGVRHPPETLDSVFGVFVAHTRSRHPQMKAETMRQLAP
jgi:hypothetical protein